MRDSTNLKKMMRNLTKMQSLDIDFNELISVVGEPSRSAGSQHYFQCPACAAGGGDTHRDNLLFNTRKGTLKCFACDDGAKETLKLINAKRHQTNYVPQARSQKEVVPMWWEKNADNLWIYQCEAEAEMTIDVLNWLLDKHGICGSTVRKCGIGYDDSPTMLKMGASVAFPMLSMNHLSDNGSTRLVGFELREIAKPLAGQKRVIKHTPEAPSCLCLISGSTDCKKLAICEGFKDAYCFMQLLEKKGIVDDYLF